MLAVSELECVECVEFESLATGLTEAGDHAQNEIFAAVGPVTPELTDSVAGVSFVLRREPAQLVGRDGAIRRVAGRDEALKSAVLVRTGTRWSMLGIGAP